LNALLKTQIKAVAGKYPSLVILLALINGALPGISDLHFPFQRLVFCIIAIPLLGCKESLKFALFTLVGILSLQINSWVPSNNYTKIIGRGNCGAAIEVRIIDPSCSSKGIKWLENPSLIRSEIRKIRFSPDQEWATTSGKFVLKPPKDFGIVKYGDVLCLEGVFIEPSAPAFKTGFDFKKFLMTRGVRRIFYADNCKKIESEPGFFGGILRVRDFFMEGLVKNIKDLDNKRLLAALIFGCKQGIDRETRKEFIESGVIHVFTVSGLHVGILALILGWALRWLPFRSRHLLLPVFIFIYALTTGLHPPAFRAFLMISLWCFFRTFLYSVPPLNIVFLSASIIAFFNPLFLADMGFQYSFVIAGFLIFSAGPIQVWIRMLSEMLNWIPPEAASFGTYLKYRVLRTLAGSFIFCAIAWLASSGITLFYQGYYIPASIISNIIMAPFVMFLFVLSILKFILAPLFVFSQFFAVLIEGILNGMTYLAGAASSFAGDSVLPSPPLWSVPVFYCGLIFLIASQKRRSFLISASAVFIIVCGWHFRNDFERKSAVIMYGGQSQEPMIALCRPAMASAVIVNAPSWEAAMEMSNCLNSKGIHRIESMIFQESWSEYSSGFKFLMRGLELERVILPDSFRRSKKLVSDVKKALETGTELLNPNFDYRERSWRFDSPLITAEEKNNCFEIEYNASKFNINVKILNDELGRRTVLIGRSGNFKTLKLENCNELKFREIDL
jgi:ComEC/Rec2-related protein